MWRLSGLQVHTEPSAKGFPELLQKGTAIERRFGFGTAGARCEGLIDT